MDDKRENLQAGSTIRPSRDGSSELGVLTTEQLFGKRQEIAIVHDGEAYRLRITRNNKLILTK